MAIIIQICIICAIFYCVNGFPADKSRILCPPGTEAIMDNDLSEMPCYKIIRNKMTYFEASYACKRSNGFIPGIDNNYKDISITSKLNYIF